MRVATLLLVFLAPVKAWTTSTVSRQDFVKTASIATSSWLVSSALPALAEEKLPSGVTYSVMKSGDGPKPEIGELAAIRFAAYSGEIKIDDIFDTPEPYYTRLGSGGLLKGVETTLPLMRVGDRWKLSIPVSVSFKYTAVPSFRKRVFSHHCCLSCSSTLQSELAFGKKGRPASAGKPRIPADSTIIFDVEIVGLPGKEPELIDLIGDVE
jgi:peptidylprolyl isomerase